MGMAMFAASPSTIMEAAFGRFHNSGADAFGARPIVVESIMVDGKAANIAIQPVPNDSLTTYYVYIYIYIYINKTFCLLVVSFLFFFFV